MYGTMLSQIGATLVYVVRVIMYGKNSQAK